MTLPDERYRSVKQTEEFLRELCYKTPRIPKAVREEARRLLRHYPTTYDLDRAAARSPDVFAAEMDPLYKLVLSHTVQDTIADDMGLDKLPE